MVTLTGDEEIYIREKGLVAKTQPQLDHAKWHAAQPMRWRVGVVALDAWARDHRTENVTHLLGLPVVRDTSLERDEILLEFSR
jgi:hypothetical protein